MATNPLPELSRLALGATKRAPSTACVRQALELVRNQTGAVAASIFYGERDTFEVCAIGDDPERYPDEALRYLQQRLVHLRVPLAFNLSGHEVRYMTRAENKQPRDHVAWLVPAADSWTELLILRGSWPHDAVVPLLDFVDSALPAITIMMERFVGAGRKQRLERQLATITTSAETLNRAAEVIGSVAAVQPAVRALPEGRADELRTLAEEAALAVDEVRANRDLMEAHLRLQEYTSRLEVGVKTERQRANKDPLTGLLNHGGALQLLQEAVDTATSNAEPLSLLIGDIDGFRLFNDTYGYVHGDNALKLVSDACRKAVEPDGTVCRYGGDEFLLVLPGKDKTGASGVAEAVTQRLAQAEVRIDSKDPVPVSMSLGIAVFPEDTSSASNLVVIADAAMCEARVRARGPDGSVVTAGANTTFSVLDSLVLAVDAKDRYTRNHCEIVAEYAVKLAERMGLPEEARRGLRIAGLLHDIGKLAVPDEILKKPAVLTLEEYEVMQRHVRIGEVLIREVPQLQHVLQAVSSHHERYDGSGYPRATRGQDIPLLGRVIALADVYSAMCLDRPYRKAVPHDHILQELVAGAGVQFDPDITRVFVELLLEEQLHKRRLAA